MRCRMAGGLRRSVRWRRRRSEGRPGPAAPVFLTPIAVSDANQTPTQPAPTPVEPQSGAKDFIAPPPAAIAGTALLAADEQPIDFLGALQLAEAQNPDIGLSRQAIQDALAQQLQARSLMLPSVHVGANYRDHQGILQTSSGKMLDVDFSSLYVGNGALATAAGTTVIPGIQMFGNVSDGIFAPLAARQLVASRGFQAQAASNQILLEVARRFVDLVRAEGDLHALLLSEKDTDQAVQITRAFARAQQGRDADARRAETTALLLHSKTLRAEENLLTASAELVRVLSLDPAIRLRDGPAERNARIGGRRARVGTAAERGAGGAPGTGRPEPTSPAGKCWCSRNALARSSPRSRSDSAPAASAADRPGRSAD